MKNPDTLSKENTGKQFQGALGLDPLIILSLIAKNWYYFIIAICLALFGARFYIRHTMPVYLVSTTVLVNETGDRPVINNDELLQGLGLSGGMRNLENQIMILTSREVTERTLQQLPFEIEFFHKTIRNNISIYPISPIRIASENDAPLPKELEYVFKYLGDGNYMLTSESEHFPLDVISSFGETIETPLGRFRIEIRDEEWLNHNINRDLHFIIHDRASLVNYFNSRLEVDLETRGGSILRISMQGTNIKQDVDFLNNLTEVFKSISLDKKNKEAERRVQFIDDQLVGISDSLSLTENRLQQFRSSNRIMDVSAQGQAIIAQITLLENERDRLKLEANYYDYLADYLAKDVTGEIPIVPITMGINDPGLTRLVTDLADLQGQLLSQGAGEMNPLQNLLAQRVRSTRESLLETLNGLRRANSLAISENEDQLARINRQASTLPITERQLLGIERKFRLNDELYTFLLETRAEQQMQKASNTADSEVIDPADADFSLIISPDLIKVYFSALSAGLLIPFLIIVLFHLFNKKISSEDIDRITMLPVIGSIPHNSEKTNKVVFDFPASGIAEAYRLLRSRLQFFTKDEVAPVILVTSSMPGDGKTFTAINLASVYSLLGKKTILVGFDMRKPKIFADFGLSNEKGVSTWLIGQDKMRDIIQQTAYENLSIITAGPVPPNPSELTALEKTRELISFLRENYDLVVIDSSPIGIVSDTFHLASIADACILVVRPGKTLKDILQLTLKEMDINGVRGLSMVINDIRSANKPYVYSNKFGYSNNKEV